LKSIVARANPKPRIKQDVQEMRDEEKIIFLFYGKFKGDSGNYQLIL
jgi:hypothetical protein